jgi:D-alanyl-D-alanine carboxypeptidase/D-alanyl-D-alanine-endopeptidase (penicillin-binding protein 4)
MNSFSKNTLLLLITSALFALLLRQWSEQKSISIESPTELALIIARSKSDPSLASAAIGLCVLDSDGKVLFEDNARSSFIPASTLKTLTTATTLEVLGPEFRFHTRVKATAPIEQGVINGDLIISGGGDPKLSLKDLRKWASSLKELGVKRLTGRIIGDGSLFKGSLFDDFWNWGDIGNGYGSPVSGLNLEHNRYTATFRAGPSVGDPTEFLGSFPELPAVTWINETTTGERDSGDGVVIHGGERTPFIHLRGTVPIGAADFTVVGAVTGPEFFAAHHFRMTLMEEGIEVAGSATSTSELEKGVPMASVTLIDHPSPALTEIITSIHSESDNHETECLFRYLGLHQKKTSELVIRDHWKSRGLVFEGLRMEDGCGLARADFIRPLDLALLQFRAATGPTGSVYESTLLTHSQGRLRAKGGAMSSVHSYTGITVNAAGQRTYFALMVNHHTDSKAAYRLRDSVVRHLLRANSIP